MLMPITLTIAAAAALLNIWIAWRVGRARMAHKVSIGDGGNPALTARMRAHANYVEYTPFFLILLALIELARGSETWLWGAAILFIAARLLHPFGMDRGGGNLLRVIGVTVTWLVLLGLAAYALALPYSQEASAPLVTYT